MKRIPVATVALGALLALTGCGSDADQERIAELEEQVSALEQEVEAQSQSDMPFDIPEEFNSRMTGPVEATIGEPVEVDVGIYEGENNHAGVVTLDSVEFSDTCGDGQVPESGVFATLEFSLETDPEADSALDFNSNTLSWPGYSRHLSSVEALDCEIALDSRDAVEPGQSGQYLMVLELPETNGVLEWSEPTFPVMWSIGDGSSGESTEESPGEDDSAAESSISFDSCEEADFHWGGLMNDDLDGLEVDEEELADTEAWMQDNGCW